MNIPCCIFAECDDVTIPTTNYSAEAPDLNLAIGYNFGIPGFFPPLNSPFTATGCVAVCEATTQVLADQCAERQWIECLVTPPPTNPETPPWTQTSPPGAPGAPLAVFSNTEQSCAGSCPDGTPFTFVVPAGTYFAFTQAEADAMAQSYACTQLPSNMICLSELGGEVCVGSFFNLAGFVSGNGPFDIFVASGSLPPGVSLVQTGDSSFSIVGTATATGSFSFTVEAVDPNEEAADKTYNIGVVGIGTISLPQGTATQNYDFVLSSAGPVTGPVTWFIASGFLPTGLSLNSATGEITGTPSNAGTSSFTVEMGDGAISCFKKFSITVGSPVSPCMMTLQAAWTVGPSNFVPATLNPTDVRWTFPDVTVGNPPNNQAQISKAVNNNTGSPYTLHVTVTWNASDPPAPYNDTQPGEILILLDGNQILLENFTFFSLIGSKSVDVNMPVGVHTIQAFIGSGILGLSPSFAFWRSGFSGTFELSCS